MCTWNTVPRIIPKDVVMLFLTVSTALERDPFIDLSRDQISRIVHKIQRRKLVLKPSSTHYALFEILKDIASNKDSIQLINDILDILLEPS